MTEARKIGTNPSAASLAGWVRSAAARVGEPQLAKARTQLLDFAGVVLATESDPACAVRPPVSGVLAPEARAFNLASRSHHLDYDDTYQDAQIHPSGIVWAALLTSGVSDGRRFLALYAAGVELFCRMAAAVTLQRTWFITQVLGGIAGAVVSGVARGASDEVIERAVGLALMQASGTKQPGASVGSLSRRIYPAFAAHAAVFATELALAGVDGPRDWCGGDTGFGKAYLDDDSYGERLVALLADDDFGLLAKVSPKQWPCCSLTHPYVRAIRELRREGLVPSPVDAQVTLHVAAEEASLVHPEAGRRRPVNVADAKYSMPFVSAMALVRDPTLPNWMPDIIDDSSVLDVAARIRIELGSRRAVVVERTGVERAIDTALMGEPEWTPELTRAKFDECLGVAGLTDVADELAHDVMSLSAGVDVNRTRLGSRLAALADSADRTLATHTSPVPSGAPPAGGSRAN